MGILSGSKYFLAKGPEPYGLAVVAAKAGTFGTASGPMVDARLSFVEAMQDIGEIDTLIVSGRRGTILAFDDQLLLEYVRAAGPRARRIVSIYTGTIILAEAGL